MFKSHRDFWNFISRRRFLQMLAGAGAAGSLIGPGMLKSWALAAERAVPAFQEISASASGISWVHVNGRSPMAHLPETVGAGCAFVDYDNDGWMDIYLVNSGRCDFYEPKQPLRNALYRNNRDGTFTDVTSKSGVAGTAYGMGVAVGDYDGDGFPDLYVTQYPRSILYHNNGDGTFTDVTSKAGVAAPGWATSSVWFDYDNDGRLDLFVCRFVDYSKDKLKFCGDLLTGERHYCIPSIYDPMPCWLFHNNGDGTFSDVSKQSGIAQSLAKAWGVVAADINNDGLIDLYVTNDTVPNFLFANRGKGKFEEIGLLAGVGVNAFGKPRSGMGADAADYDQDGWIDLFEANVDHEMYSLYHNDKNEAFSDASAPAGIGAATRLMSGWGLKFFDYDNDGNVDLLLCNGHPDDTVDKRIEGVTFLEPMLLFRNTGKGFENVSQLSGPIFSKRLSGRGLALGDFDNDGSVDVLVTQNNGTPVLLRNNAGRQNHWLGVRLVGTKANIDAIGAEITYQAGDLKRHQVKIGGGSYLSSHDPRMVLGIEKRTKIDWLEVRWPQPGGKVERFTDVPIDRYVTIVEGQGKVK
ncbi:MAG: FG-GAP-like repeat-containing protein [Acidobacteriia bacterium]|nr:FG-GAP-like repeat-containing protein [Terriglobia bacterium]